MTFQFIKLDFLYCGTQNGRREVLKHGIPDFYRVRGAKPGLDKIQIKLGILL